VVDPITGDEYDSCSEEWRHICECRYWLRRGYTSPAKVETLRMKVAEKRGAEAAARLVQGMRQQWRVIRSQR
jgi:hypothetical protein